MAGENQSQADLVRKLALRGMTAADADGDQTDATDNAAGGGILVSTVAGGGSSQVQVSDGTDTMLVTTSGAAHVNVAEIAGTTTSTGVGASGAGVQRVAALIHDGTDTALVNTDGSLYVQQRTNTVTGGVTLLSAVTAGQLGTVFDMGNFCTNFVMALEPSAALTSTDVVVLLGSCDGGNFYPIVASAAITTDLASTGGGGTNARAYSPNAAVNTNGLVARYIRAGIGTITNGFFTASATAITGGNLTVKAMAW